VSPASLAFVALSAGGSHSLGLRSDGTVWAWGYNGYGQLGNGTTTNTPVPAQVSGLSGVVAIAAGANHSLALRSDGTVWAWGNGAYGQLGDGATGNAATPVQVKSLSGIVSIAAGGYHSLALRSDGTVWAWGYNNAGQLGDGHFTTNSSVPVQMVGPGETGTLSGVVAIAAGGSHGLALLSGGTVDSWGSNSNGQLGNNSTTNTDAPVAISGLSGVAQISGGADHSLALDNTGRVWAWGLDSSGQLGNGNTTDQHVPAQMSSVQNGGAALGTGSEGKHSLIIGQPYVSLSATTLNFGAEPVGTPSSSQTETVTNTGVVALRLKQDQITGSDGDEFTITGDGCAGTTLPAGGSCTIGLRFDPKVTGTPAATLRIQSNSPTSPDLVTLDPPAQNPRAHAATVSCKTTKAARRRLTVSCRFASTLRRRTRRLTLRLKLGKSTLATAHTARTRARSITLTVRLKRRLEPGTYTLVITTTDPASQTTQTIKRHGR
jgi:hypothetical protein